MALSIHEAASILSVKPARGFQFKSTVPYVLEDVPGGASFEFDYSWNHERGEQPEVLVTAIRLVTHDGTEYPIKVASVCGRWLAEMEFAISEELAAGSDAAWGA